MDETQKSGSATMIVIILVVILALGGFYFWNKRDTALPAEDASPIVEITSTSDEVTDIENDLNSTDLNSPDYNLDEENFNAS